VAAKNSEAKITCESVTVQVDRFQPMLAGGTCKGFARVTFRTDVGSVSIDNFRLLESKKGGYFVAPPSHKKGEKFYDDVSVDGDLGKILRAVITQAYEESQAK
jgi:DNA-binding cell septation regulator SpoVG